MENYGDYERAFARRMPHTNLPFWDGKPMFVGSERSLSAKAGRRSVPAPSVGHIGQRQAGSNDDPPMTRMGKWKEPVPRGDNPNSTKGLWGQQVGYKDFPSLILAPSVAKGFADGSLVRAPPLTTSHSYSYN